MKRFQLSCFIFVVLLGNYYQAHGQSLAPGRGFHAPSRKYELTSLLFRLRLVKEVSSKVVGWGVRGEFFLLSEDILRVGDEGDFKRMLDDENPIVRAMGLICLAQSNAVKHADALRSRLGDDGQVGLLVGCVGRRARVGEIASMLLADPDFLGHSSKRTPE
ncbi:MAG: hypothetical protein ACJ741_20320 [Pyrinomonadaceae bacterium]